MSASSLNFIAQQVFIYIGIPIFIAGILGGCFNIIVFLSLRTFRESSCAFYLTILSFTNVSQLITGLLTRIMITGFNIDWTRNSLFYCKLRPFILNLSSLMSSACLCLATIDQYFATCTRPRWQQWCNIKLAHRLTIICLIICFLEQIPSLAFYKHIITSSSTNQTICSITNAKFSLFNSYFTILILWFLIPLLCSIFFGSLAYHNVQQIAYRTNPLIRQELDKQLTVMVLVEVLINFITLIPDVTTSLLSSNGNIQANALIFTRINFANTISICLFYISFSSPFYIYICVSERFRRQFIYVIFNIHLNRVQQHLQVINQVAPLA